MHRHDGAGAVQRVPWKTRAGRTLRVVGVLSGLLTVLWGPSNPAMSQVPDAPVVEDMPAGSSLYEREQRRRSRSYEAFQESQKRRYEQFQEDRSADYEAYMERLRSSYERFVGIVEEAESNERERIAERWDDPELSSQKVWVEYSEDLSTRNKVDFGSGTITLESFEGGGAEGGMSGLRERVRALVLEDRATAFADDRVAQEIERQSLRQVDELETAKVEATPILWPYLTGEDNVDEDEIDAVVDWLVAKAVIREVMVGGERLQRVEIPLDSQSLLAQLDRLQSGEFAAQMPTVPPEAIPLPFPQAPKPEQKPRIEPRTEPVPVPPPVPEEREQRPVPQAPRRPLAKSGPESARRAALPARARAFLDPVSRHGGSRSLDPALVFSIIETESAFNPLARSPVPAYGLMQIVPRSAGQDATQVLFGRPRILAPSYLYSAEKNIEIGAIYLDILFGRYLSGIRDPQSRLYCVIAAYNTGAGNVFRAFTGRTKPKAAFQEINAMSPQDVYRHLIWNLPYKETRNYLAKVVARMDTYRPR